MSDYSSSIRAPRISVVLAVDTTSEFPYMGLLQSLLRLRDREWEIVVVGDIADDHVLPNDSRVRLIAAGSSLSDSLNIGIAAARSDYVMLGQQDGTLRVAILTMLIDQILATEIPDVVFSDEAVFENRRNLRSILKPDFSPERLRCQFYFGNAVVYKKDFLDNIGGVDVESSGFEHYELALRASRATTAIQHFGEILFVSKIGTPRPWAVDKRALPNLRIALDRHLTLTGGGWIEAVNESGIHRTHRDVIGNPLVSIVIPSRGSSGEVRGSTRCLVIDAVKSIFEKSSYQNIEVVIVMDTVVDQAVTEELQVIGRDRLKLVWWDQPFSFSAKINKGVFYSEGEFVIFLNDDVEVISTSWIEAMLSLCQLPGSGMAGALLYFEDDSIQHAGHLYEGGNAGHIGTNGFRGASGSTGALTVERECLGVTAACSMMPRKIFDEVGGFSLLLPGNFNDVDLCMKVTQGGHKIYWTPHAELYHFESKTRLSRITEYEVDLAWGRWHWRLNDTSLWPYGNGHLMPDEEVPLLGSAL